ncbi:MAG: glycosyltransferase family 4 protein, partial [Anaerolinea sp.]|nr:glycosyltransferase family 4 protein [Anaerolinea sp.]
MQPRPDPDRPRMNILYVLDVHGEGLEGICALRREQIARVTDRTARTAIHAFAVSPQPLPPAARALFDAALVIPLPPWGDPPSGPLRRAVRRLIRTARAHGEADAAEMLADWMRSHPIDLVHSATARFQTGALAAALARRPHLWHIREWIGAIGRLRFPLRDRALVDAIARRSAAVVVPGVFAGAIFQLYRAPGLHIVLEGVDPMLFERAPRPATAHPPVIGMRGGLIGPWQQHDRFIALAARIRRLRPQVHFTIGSGPNDDPAYARRVVRLAQRLVPATDDHPGILFTRQDHMPITVLVHPCPTETVARPVLLAQAARIPVVGPHSGALAEIVRDGVTGLLTAPDDLDALTRAVITLIDDPGLCATLGEA